MERSEEEKEKEKRQKKEEERAAFLMDKAKLEQVDEKAPFEDLVDSQGERLSQGLILGDEDDSEESDWEEGGQKGLGGGEGSVREYNSLNLHNGKRSELRLRCKSRPPSDMDSAV